MSKARILIPWYKFPPYDQERISGISISVSELIRNLALNDFEVDVLVGESKSSIPVAPDSHGFRILYNEIGTKIFRGVSLDDAGQSLLREYDYIFSLHNFGARSLRNLKEKLRIVRQIHAVFRIVPIRDMVYVRHTPFDFAKAYVMKKRYVKEESLLNGTTTLCVSKHLMNEMMRLRMEYQRNLFVYPIGVDKTAFFPLKSEKKFDLLFTGGFHRIKGIDILFEALLLLRNAKVKLGVIGNFSDSQQRYLVRHLSDNVRENIRFLGVVHHNKMPLMIRSAKFVVVPSRYESFSLITLESLACGIPVIASDISAIQELIDPSTGILFKASSPLDLAKAIQRALDDRETIADTALSKGPAKAATYNWPLIIKQLKNILEKANPSREN